MTHYAYEAFPNRWATFAAFLGLTTAVQFWMHRGPRKGLLWPVSVFGVVEGSQVFACQIAQNWWAAEAGPFHGMCDVYTGVPLYLAGLSALSILAYWGISRG